MMMMMIVVIEFVGLGRKLSFPGDSCQIYRVRIHLQQWKRRLAQMLCEEVAGPD